MPPTAGRDDFGTTQWSLVLRAGGDESGAREALASLCRDYWLPVYSYTRRHAGPSEAEDLTQGFFAHLLAGRRLAAADPSRGRFRAFLLTCLKNYLANENARATAHKRGGGVVIVPLGPEAEARCRAASADHLPPDRLFDRQWALAALDAALCDLEAEEIAAGRADQFARLRPALTGKDDVCRYAEVAAALGATEDAIKKAAQRLRARYGAAVRRRVAGTVDDPDDVDAEVRDLFDALSGS